MSYCITEVRHKAFPDAGAVSGALSSVGLTLDDIVGTFRGYVCALTSASGRSVHAELAENLKSLLEQALTRDGLRPTRNRHDLAYSRSLNEHADFALVHDASNRRVLFELEFAASHEKELLNFQIAANEGILTAAVMLVPIDRRTAGLTSIGLADYDSVTRIVTALQPSYPLLVIGIRGSEAA